MRPPPQQPRPESARSRSRDRLRLAGLAFLTVGALLVLIPLVSIGYGYWQERQLTSEWSTVMASVPPGVEPSPSIQPSTSPGQPQATPVAGRPPIVTPRTSIPIAFAMRIPKIGYYAAVREGVTKSVLFAGPGHYGTTANPGFPGTVGIAAHNTYWLGVGKLDPGDAIVLETRYGTFTYKVTRTAIVAPTDGSVLAQRPGKNLTLTTCWPLWAGALAPDRLAIFATEVGSSS
jgi:LPXTG-site transpeptidase (sortase) family protein